MPTTTTTITLTGPPEAIAAALADLRSSIDWERLPVRVTRGRGGRA